MGSCKHVDKDARHQCSAESGEDYGCSKGAHSAELTKGQVRFQHERGREGGRDSFTPERCGAGLGSRSSKSTQATHTHIHYTHRPVQETHIHRNTTDSRYSGLNQLLTLPFQISMYNMYLYIYIHFFCLKFLLPPTSDILVTTEKNCTYKRKATKKKNKKKTYKRNHSREWLSLSSCAPAGI